MNVRLDSHLETQVTRARRVFPLRVLCVICVSFLLQFLQYREQNKSEIWFLLLRPQEFVDDVFAAGARAGERYWQLPLIEEYRADMESWTGDIVNYARNNEGGLVKSAIFISEFVTKPWVHLDIAGTGYYRKATPYAPRGATGVSHATLVELALAGARA